MSYMTSYMTRQLFDWHHNFGIWHRVSECRCYDVICRCYDIVCRCYDVICRCYDVVCRCYDVTCVYDITYNSMGPLISRIAWFQVQCFGIVPAAARAQSQGERWLTADAARGPAPDMKASMRDSRFVGRVFLSPGFLVFKSNFFGFFEDEKCGNHLSRGKI